MSDQEKEERIKKLEADYEILLAEVRANTKITSDIQCSIKELLDLFSTVKSGLKLAGYLGGFAKWITTIAVAIGAVYASYYNTTKGN